MFFFKKSQSSMEYLIIFGMALFLITIIGGVFFTYSNQSKNKLDQEQLDLIGKKIISNVEQIYFYGEGNRIPFKTTFPDKIENFTIVHVNKTGKTFDYLNISYYDGENELKSSIFLTKELYIRFNLTNYEKHTPNIGGNWISYVNESYLFSSGPKTIRIESFGSYVGIEFVVDEE